MSVIKVLVAPCSWPQGGPITVVGDTRADGNRLALGLIIC